MFLEKFGSLQWQQIIHVYILLIVQHIHGYEDVLEGESSWISMGVIWLRIPLDKCNYLFLLGYNILVCLFEVI